MTPVNDRTNTLSGKNPKRNITGLLLLDKPAGATSNGVLQRVRHLYGAKKAGHTGSLDPSATGMLPICFGEATKLCGYLLDSSKTYQVDAVLGVTTDTEDADGTVTAARPVPPLERLALEEIVGRFHGNQMQRPPVYSALKRNGVRVHKLARKGIEVELEPRPITVHDISLTEFSGSHFSLVMKVSKGTYVRSIVRDIGEAVGCGAHVLGLRRTAVAPFEEQALVTIDALQDASNLDDYLLQADVAVADRTALTIDDETAKRFCHGAKPQLGEAQTADLDGRELLRIYDRHECFLGLGNLCDGRLHTVRLIASQT